MSNVKIVSNGHPGHTSHEQAERTVLMLPTDKKDLYLGRAKRLYSAGKDSSVVIERVIAYLNKAISYSPDPECYLLLAKAYLHAQDLTSSIYCLRYVYKAQMEKKSTDISLTKKKLSEMFSIKGKEFMLASSGKTNTNVTMQLYTWADLMFQESARLNKSLSQNYVQRSICLVRKKEFSLALKNLIRAYACEDSKSLSYEVVIFRAKVYFGMGLQDEGNRDMRSIIDKIPNHVEVERYIRRTYIKTEKIYNLSLQAFANRNYAESKRFIEFAFQITPDDIKLHVLLSKVHRMTGNLHEAYISIQQAAAIYRVYSNNNNDLPEFIAKQTNLVLNLMALDLAGKAEYDKAIILFTNVINSEINLSKSNNLESSDVDYRYFLNRGDCYRAISDFDKAIVDYNCALAREMSNWDIKTRLSISYYSKATEMFNSCDYHDANINISHAIEHNSKVAHFYALRGKVRYYLGLFDEAFADFDKVKQLESSSDMVADMLNQYDSNKSKVIIKRKKDNANKSRDKGIERVVPSDHDIVHSLLNPKLAMKLPSLKLLRNDASLQDNCKKIYRPSKMHTIFSLAGQEIERNVSTFLKSKFNPVKDSAWSIVSHASRKSKILNDDAKKTKSKGAQTSSALKRLSQEKTKQNLQLNPIIGGVVSTKNDPALLSLATKPSALSGIFRIKENDSIKVARKWSENEEQPQNKPSSSGRPRENQAEKSSGKRIADIASKKKGAASSKKEINPDIAKRLNITLAHELSDSSDSEEISKSGMSSCDKSSSSSYSSDDDDDDNERKSTHRSSNDEDGNSEGKVEEEESQLAAMLLEAGVESTINLFDSMENDSHLLLSLEDELKLLQKRIELENRTKNIELSMELAHHED